MMVTKAIFGVLLSVVLYAAALLLPAGRLAWGRAWVFLGILALASGAMGVWLYRNNRPLLRERLSSPVQRDQLPTDRVLVTSFVLLFFGWLAFIPVDVFRLQLLPRPGLAVSLLGLGLVVVGLWIVFLTLRENSFAAPVVKRQDDRQHVVVDTGVYRVVRHPMYAGIAVLSVGAALWLESWAAAVLALVPVTTLAVRILVEERFLETELDGYSAYKSRVRFRLIPHVW